MSMLNLILRQRYSLSDDIIGSLFSLIAIIGSLAVPVVSFLCQRYSNRRIASATLIVQMLAILAMTFAPIWLFVLLVCARTMTTNFVYSVVDSPMLQSVNTDRRGTYSGLRVFANYIGMGLGSAISGYFISKEQYALLFLVAGVLCLAQNLIFHYICVPHIRDYE
jgi:predicted MFS family arabinose efflux permease